MNCHRSTGIFISRRVTCTLLVPPLVSLISLLPRNSVQPHYTAPLSNSCPRSSLLSHFASWRCVHSSVSRGSMPNSHYSTELSVGYPDDMLGSSNVQRGSAHPTDWDILTAAAGWRVTLDGSGQWLSWDANNWQRCAFCLVFAPHRPQKLALQADGSLQALDEAGRVVWQRGPFGVGDRWKLTVESDGDVVLRNVAGEQVWSAMADCKIAQKGG